MLHSPGSAQETKNSSKARHFATAIRYPAKEKAKPVKEGKWVELPRRQQRVVGGKDAVAGSYPWMVALLSSANPDNYDAQFCGGSLVHPYWVVTAAHCVEGTPPDQVEVLLGGHDLSDSSAGTRIPVAEIIIHPDYTATNSDADVALVRLEMPAGPEWETLPLIDDAALEAPGTLARALGWGDTTGDGVFPEILQEVDLPLVDFAVANATEAHAGALLESMLAAGVAEGGIDTCGGDSGGPLVIPTGSDVGWALAGITSFGIGCAEPDSYGIYAKVSMFRRFFMNHLYPGYSAWEEEQGVMGESRDSNGDGIDHFGDYAFRSMPQGGAVVGPHFEITGAGEQAMRLRILDDPAEVAYRLEWSDALDGWSGMDLTTAIAEQLEIPEDPPAREVLVSSGRGTSSPHGFLRASAEPSGALVSGLRELSAVGRAEGALTTADPIHPDFPGRREKLYRVVDAVPGAQYRLSGRSQDFDVRLELFDAAAPGTAPIIADADAAGGTDEELLFTAVAGADYRLRITSASDGESGPFLIGTYDVAVFAALPPAGVPSTNSGTLSATDGFDPLWRPLPIHADDFRLVAAAGQRLEISLTGSFDCYLAIIDEETDRPVAEDDDGGGGLDSRLFFNPQPGVPYRVRVSSAAEMETGSYTLSVAVAPALPTLPVPGTRSGLLTTSDPEDPNYPGTYADDYELTGVSSGQTVTVLMQSVPIDCYLFLIDAADGSIIDFNDDADGSTTNSELTFVIEEGIDYVIRATSYDAGETGGYTLIATSP